jgi:hypothetical protein
MVHSNFQLPGERSPLALPNGDADSRRRDCGTQTFVVMVRELQSTTAVSGGVIRAKSLNPNGTNVHPQAAPRNCSSM